MSSPSPGSSPPPATNTTSSSVNSTVASAPEPSTQGNGTSSATPVTPSTPTAGTNSTPPVPPVLPRSGGGGLPPGTLAGLIVGIVIGGLVVLIGVCIVVIFYRKKKRKKKQLHQPQGPKDESTLPPLHNVPPSKNKDSTWPKPTPLQGISPYHQLESPVQVLSPPLLVSSPSLPFGYSQSMFTYEELADATNGFSSTNLLGQGGYGYVHKGVLPNGKVVAVKQLKAGSRQGEREFQAEVEIISRIHHRHLVSLVGYCISGEQRMLVYEFVPNNTLQCHLHGKERPTMSWPIRMRVALGSARGLAYLHEGCHPKVIHRDIKAANILLDFSFEAKVADFGLAKFSEDTDTHVSTRVMGTFGYLAPEYASSGQLTEKSDVFSFGVVLLELITGRRPIDRARPFADDASIVEWARPLLAKALEDNDFEPLADPRLENNYDHSEMGRMVACAAASVRHSGRLRPKMSQIVRALERNLSLQDLNEGVLPGHSGVYSPYVSSDYDSGQCQEDLKKFRKMAMDGQEMTTSEYSVPTSEFGGHPSSSSFEVSQSAIEMESGNRKNKDFSTVTGISPDQLNQV